MLYSKAKRYSLLLTLVWAVLAFGLCHSSATPGELFTVDGLYAGSIVKLRDGSLITEDGRQSFDGGRSWRKSRVFRPVSFGPSGEEGGPIGLIRMKNGELGSYYSKVDQPKGTHLDAALGDATNRWYFAWSADEGRSWSEGVPVTLPGFTNGLQGQILMMANGRLVIFGYTQLIGAMPWNRSYGEFKGVRYAVESEGHIPDEEACRAYYSDDNGRSWKANDSWIIGWRADERRSDSVTEPCGIELGNGRLLMITRALNGHLYRANSPDRGKSWWPGAVPMAVSSSNSPCALIRLPKSGQLALIWNQMSRDEILRGLRRSRLSSAVSKDDGKTWGNYKNIASISVTADRAYIPSDPSLELVAGRNELGKMPDDMALFDYPRVNVVGNLIFVAYGEQHPLVASSSQYGDAYEVREKTRFVTRVFTEDWFYRDTVNPR